MKSPAGLQRVSIGPDLAQAVAEGRRRVFPAELIEEMAFDLNLSGGEAIPATEYEAAVVSFVRALLKDSWRLYRPARGVRNSAKRARYLNSLKKVKP